MFSLGKKTSTAKKQRTQRFAGSPLGSFLNRKRKADESTAQFNDSSLKQNLSFLAFSQHPTLDKENRQVSDNSLSNESLVPNPDYLKNDTKSLSHDSLDESMMDCHPTSMNDQVSPLTSQATTQGSASIDSNEKTQLHALIRDLQNKLTISSSELATTKARLKDAHATIDELRAGELPLLPDQPLENNLLYQHHMERGRNMEKMYREEDQEKLPFDINLFNDHAYQPFNNESLENDGKFTLERQRDKPVKVNFVDDPNAKVKYNKAPPLTNEDLPLVLYKSIQELQNGEIDEDEFAKRFECTIHGKNVSKYKGKKYKLVIIAKMKSCANFEKWTKVKYLNLAQVLVQKSKLDSSDLLPNGGGYCASLVDDLIIMEASKFNFRIHELLCIALVKEDPYGIVKYDNIRRYAQEQATLRSPADRAGKERMVPQKNAMYVLAETDEPLYESCKNEMDKIERECNGEVFILTEAETIPGERPEEMVTRFRFGRVPVQQTIARSWLSFVYFIFISPCYLVIIYILYLGIMPMKPIVDGAFVLRKNKDDPSKIDLIATKQNLSGDQYHWKTFKAAMELKEIKGELFIRYVKGMKAKIKKNMKKAVKKEEEERKKSVENM
ncbi:predicted protein [Chaetoceros tenuissimus]|uniref:Uncharacterized protein n=1 Tax=Chaetoceros tenuissimus TaxID=426638 RepID=A0AAD3D0R6_9STRA|nr:predicted protein [Chaetoceros tenuissimus]